MSDIVTVYFFHPRNDLKTLAADISPQSTGQEVIRELRRDADGNGAFLPRLFPSQSYGLVVRRSSQEITPKMTFAEAGVVDGDAIDVLLYAIGAGPGTTWSELGQMIFWSTAAASLFLKSAAPILVEFLRGGKSRSIKFRCGEEDWEATGYSPEEVKEIVEMLRPPHRDPAMATDRLPSPIIIVLRDPETKSK